MHADSAEQYKKLEVVLNDIVRVYRHLLALVRKEREILISSNLDDLTESNIAKEAMLIKAKALEDHRVQICKTLSLLEGLNPDTTKLMDFARHFGGETGDRLMRVHSVLELLLKRVREHNRQNEVLVKSALNTVTGAMDNIRDAVSPKKTYAKGGKMRDANPGAGQLVRKEI